MRAVAAVDYAYICVKLHSASLFLIYATGFQDRRIRPLCHPSAGHVLLYN